MRIHHSLQGKKPRERKCVQIEGQKLQQIQESFAGLNIESKRYN